ncbi:MAG TPA: ABC transporter ATP-binding protein [Geminicoccaceae bacterium]|nr:ABC transporter ATP-binding protein [Geminicoccus sp.]HMU51255.1 ABC transporter ATP-binding protein [Geminicoccaceae bacterium]
MTVRRSAADLVLEGVVKRYGAVTALDGLSLDVAAGEFFCLLGPSAAGKTTTLRAIAGLERLQGGRILFGGTDVTAAPVQGRGIAMIFQTFALYPHLSVRDNLAYPLREARLDKAEIGRRVDEMAELLRIRHTLERKPGTASGGEQQRIAIGRALIRRPGLLLLDEPLTNLDAKLRHDTRAEFKRLHRELGMTMLYATPDELEALSLGQRIGVIRQGRMVQVGTPDAMFDEPGNVFVASQVGSPKMNLVEGVSSGDGGRVRLPFGEVASGPWTQALRAFPVGTRVLMGIRPHDVQPASGEARGPRLGSRIHLTEPLGDVTLLDLVVGGVPLKMVLPEERAVTYREGDELEVELRLEHSHLFALDTGTAIR